VKRFIERMAMSGRVDRTGKYPVIRGVLLCGSSSLNRRRYKPEAFAGDRVKRYNSKPVFLNHGDGRTSRDYRDQMGWVENPRLRSDGMPEGDIAIKPTHPLAETVLWDAEHRPSNVGMSHVANCETRPGADGWDEVIEMIEAESVDLVVGPATVKSLFEQDAKRDLGRASVSELIAEAKRAGLEPTLQDLLVLEHIPSSTTRKLVIEQMKTVQESRPQVAKPFVWVEEQTLAGTKPFVWVEEQTLAGTKIKPLVWED
jgi:hypothetical protein